jgi:hypothetical protein
MPDVRGRLRLEVWDDEIIVTLPDTSYVVAYYRPANLRHLLAKRLTNEDDRTAPMTSAEFLVEAWRAANNKARQLGWVG